MASKPASTAGKAPVGSKLEAPAKTTPTKESKKKPPSQAAAGVEGEKRKRKKV
jgi:hypothetical protein